MNASGAQLHTENLTLMLQSREETLASIEAMDPSDRAEVSPEWLMRVKATSEANPWIHGFAAVHRLSGTVVGGCGYKGPPDQNGVVEIAYGVDPENRGKGYATEMARMLVTFAFTTGDVRLVRAHTRPQNDASSRVLRKCGFELVGEVIDPEDGLVWRWELHRCL